MPGKKTAAERLDQIVEEHPHSPASTRVTITIGEARDLSAQISRLKDTVVGAAALYFGEMDSREESYVSAELHLTAAEIVKTTPRLKGGHKGGGA